MKVAITKQQHEYLMALTKKVEEARAQQITAIQAMAPGIQNAGVVQEEDVFYLVQQPYAGPEPEPEEWEVREPDEEPDEVGTLPYKKPDREN